MAGLVDEAIAASTRAYESGIAAGAIRSSQIAATQIASHYFDLGLSPLANSWLQRAASCGSDYLTSSGYSSLRIQLSLTDGDIGQAQEWYNTAVRAEAASPGGTIYKELALLRLRLQQLLGDPTLPEIDVDSLYTAATTLPRIELMDSEVAVVLQTLRCRGEVDRALV